MKFCDYITTSIGRKFLMAISGLALSLFVLSHMAGNLLLFVGPEAYNKYSHAIITNPLLYVAEFGLLALYLLHIFLAIILTIENRSAKGQKYAVNASGKKATPIAARTMILSGLLVFVFVPLHLYTFKYGAHYTAVYDGVEMRDLYTLVMETFQNSFAYVVWYIVALVVLGFHLFHGIQSTFQSLGINHPRYTPVIKNVSRLIAIVISLGFILQPIYFMILKSKGGM